MPYRRFLGRAAYVGAEPETVRGESAGIWGETASRRRSFLPAQLFEQNFRFRPTRGLLSGLAQMRQRLEESSETLLWGIPARISCRFSFAAGGVGFSH